MVKRSIFEELEGLSPAHCSDSLPPLIVARPRFNAMKRETSLPLFLRKLKGPRRAVRDFTFGGSNARWPNDHLLETPAPFLMIVLQGVADFCCGNYMIQIPKGRAILVPGRIPRRDGASSMLDISDDEKRFAQSILFSERCGELQIWINSDQGNRHYGARVDAMLMATEKRLLRVLNEMDEEARRSREFHREILQSLFEEFLWNLQRTVKEGKVLAPGKLQVRRETSSAGHDPIAEAQRFIRENLSEQLTQQTVADEVRLSRTQFIRRFREDSGQTFNQFVTHCRVEQAKVLLQQTDVTIVFISQAVGFKSPGYLNLVFRKAMGMLPNEYRLSKRDHK